MSSGASRKVVIVGIGEIVDRPASLLEGLDPLGLATAAARRAIEQAGASVDLLKLCDSVDLMHLISWRYEDTAARFTERLGIAPKRAVYGEGGGESPVAAIHRAALRIASGAARVALVCGAEANHTARKARGEGLELPWPARAKTMENPWRVEKKLHPLAIAHGITQPTLVYPFYENACAAAWGQSPDEALRESAQLWAGLSGVAATNPNAWIRRPHSAEAIATTGPDNRLVAYPYSKLQVANPMVNMASAVVLMEEQDALAAGVAPERMIFVGGAAASNEADDFLARDRYDHSGSQEAVLAAASALAGDRGFDALELYSCFPCVPKMARRFLGLDEAAPVTVTGGLTFFGGPMNNYMGHAACAMVRRLREGSGTGLLYGQGDFVTKHYALLLSTTRPEHPLSDAVGVDEDAARRRGPAPPTRVEADGEASLESFTVMFDRTGAPERGAIIARLPDGARTLARVPASDRASIATLLSSARSPIGTLGSLGKADDGLLNWSMQ
jgi:acetyl-CoA acetyltransferase